MIDVLIPNVCVPCGESGDCVISRFNVSEHEANIFNIRNFSRPIYPGEYTKLAIKGQTVMSDVPAEKRAHSGFVRKAEGNILIAGIGIGMVLNAVARKKSVDHVTVIEKSKDVIALVSDHYKSIYGAKITIINEDIFNFKPEKNILYDYAWFDIWNDICTDNWKEYKTLMRKYGRRAKHKDCWARNELKYLIRQKGY